MPKLGWGSEGGQKTGVSFWLSLTAKQLQHLSHPRLISVPDRNPTCWSLKPRMKWRLAS